MNISPEGLLMMAKACGQAERHEERFEYIKQFIETNDCELSIDERNLFSVTCKDVVGPKLDNLRDMQNFERKEHQKENENNRLPLLLDLKKKVVEEGKCFCEQILPLISTLLCRDSSYTELKVFLLKMKADYSRYLFEFSSQEHQPKIAQRSLELYKEALDIASTSLHKAHPTRLGLALNYSVFYYNVLNDEGKGHEIAKMAFDDAISVIEEIDEDTYKESTSIMQLIRDNLTLWAVDKDENQ